MSSHYTFFLSLSLDPQQAEANAEALRFVVGDEARKPDALPSHKFFSTFNLDDRPHRAYRDYDAAAWHSAFWMDTAESGQCVRAGVILCLPSNKLEGIAEDLFSLADWLASMSDADGPVGMVNAEDLPASPPMVLYVRNARLYIGGANPDEAEVYGRAEGRA